MNVYAIHRERIWTTDYNVMMYSSQDVAENKIQELNEAYNRWYKTQKDLYENHFCNNTYMDFVYNNPQPPQYRIEKFELIK